MNTLNVVILKRYHYKHSEILRPCESSSHFFILGLPRKLFSQKLNLLITLSLLLTYMPASNAEIHTVKVEISGLDKKLKKAIEAMLPLNQHKKKQNLPDSRIKLLHQRTANDIKKALQAYGYYSSEVRSELTFDNKTWYAKYAIKPGQPIRVKTINITVSGEGQHHSELLKLADNFPITVNTKQENVPSFAKHWLSAFSKPSLKNEASRFTLKLMKPQLILLFTRASNTTSLILTLMIRLLTKII